MRKPWEAIKRDMKQAIRIRICIATDERSVFDYYLQNAKISFVQSLQWESSTNIIWETMNDVEMHKKCIRSFSLGTWISVICLWRVLIAFIYER